MSVIISYGQLVYLAYTYSRFQNSLEFATPNFDLNAQSSQLPANPSIIQLYTALPALIAIVIAIGRCSIDIYQF